MQFVKVIAKIERVHFFAPQCICKSIVETNSMDLPKCVVMFLGLMMAFFSFRE